MLEQASHLKKFPRGPGNVVEILINIVAMLHWHSSARGSGPRGSQRPPVGAFRFRYSVSFVTSRALQPASKIFLKSLLSIQRCAAKILKAFENNVKYFLNEIKLVNAQLSIVLSTQYIKSITVACRSVFRYLLI